MKKFLAKSLLILAITTSFSLIVIGQTKTLPFAAGETLTYEAKVSKIISGMAVADLTFAVSEPSPGELQIKADAKSKVPF